MSTKGECFKNAGWLFLFFLLKLTLELNCVLGEKMELEIILKETD